MTSPLASGPLAVVGQGRLGTSLAQALGASGPHPRGYDGFGDAVVLLCVPDRAISTAAAAITLGPVVGHCSGAAGLDVLAPHEAFGLHPLMTVSHRGAAFRGAGCAVAGSTERGLATARALADHLGMHPADVADVDRAAYHAAASLASNSLLALEAVAEQLLAGAAHGRPARELLIPLVRATVDNWAAEGPRAALTGPVARGDHETVARQRAAIAERLPDELGVFDALVGATRRLAASGEPR